MSLVKGIKKGKTIELLEEINVPDGVEILIDIQTEKGGHAHAAELNSAEFVTVNSFWTSLEEFRNSQEFNSVNFEAETFTDLRDKTTGRNVDL